jgi:NitT/TauT family transport system substrate-binding protein
MISRIIARCGAVSLALAALLITSSTSSRAAELIPLQLGVMPIEGAAEAFYADQLGYFKANGLDVTVTVLPNGSAIIAGVVQGSLNIGFGSPPSLILARQRSLPVRYISYAPIFTGGAPLSAVMVAKNSPVKSGADLNGKIVAVAGLHDVGSYQVAAWIDKTGGDSTTVKFVEMPYSEMGVALDQGRVAAAGNTEPFITAAKDVARVVGNMNTAVAPRYLMAGWSSTDDWLQKHPDTAKRFIASMQQAARWANSHPKESAAILARITKISPDVIAVMARDQFDESARPDPRLLQPVIDLMMKYGKLAPFTATDLLWLPPR